MSGNSLALLVRRAQAIDGPLPCRREDPQLWFSSQPADLEVARAHCRPCPLRGLCLAGAVERREQDGVWGGEIFARGTIIARKRPRGRPRRQILRPGTAPAQAQHGSSGSSKSSAS
jgi:WhiB family transcriptional regulator, redox-sensing transcriptional regulator